MKDIRDHKDNLRKKALRIRQKIALRSSGDIWGVQHYVRTMEILRNSNISPLNCTIGSYFPIRNELNLNRDVTSNWIFPRVVGNELRWFSWTANLDLKKNRFGIPEAEPDQCRDIRAFLRTPLILFVPALAADTSGYRLGYGGGFYDRLIAMHGQIIFTVCCVPDKLLMTELPRDENDQRVDLVVTERRTVIINEFRNKFLV